MSTTIITQLEQYIAGDILRQPTRRIPSDQPLITGGLLSSLQLVDVALYVEDAYGVHLDDTELSSSVFDNLEQLAAIIELRRTAQ